MDEQRILNGRYRIGELIGRGGMADVFRGEDLRLHRPVAVKLMRRDLARDPHFQARFRKEARSAASLNHPSIVSVYDTGEVSLEDGLHPVDCPFLVMELVSGRTLREILHAEGAVGTDRAVAWTRGVLEALEHAHEEGIVHRDVKPANVMVTETGAVKVMDFGIAHALADTSATTSQTQAVVGTALYLAPEQATGRTVDGRADLYAAGCLLFELLTGRPPFTGDTPLAVAYQHVREEPPAPSDVDPDLPPAFDPVVLRALRKDPEDRFPTGTAFLAALEEAAADPHAGPGRHTLPLDAVPPALVGAVLGAAAAEHGADDADVPTATVPLTRPTPSVPAEPDSAQPQAANHAVAGAGLPGAASAAQLAAAAAAMDGPRPVTAGQPVTPGAAATPRPEPSPGDTPTPATATPRRVRRRVRRRTLLAAGAVLVALALLLAPWLAAALRTTVEVPTVVGLQQDEAVAALEDAGLVAIVSSAYMADAPDGTVTQSDPPTGTEVPRGAEVRIRVSRGKEGIALSDSLQGLSEDAARRERGLLARTDPAMGTHVPPGSSVVLHLSSGMVAVPDVVGMSAPDARRQLALSAPELRVRIQDEDGATTDTGTVVAQDPPAGVRVDNRSSLTLTASTWIAPTAEPSELAPPSSEAPAPTPSASASPSPPPTESPEPSGSAEPSPSPSASATPSPEPTTTETPSPTQSPSPTSAAPSEPTGQPPSTSPTATPVDPLPTLTPDPEPSIDPPPST
ncbi:Stk1 family PASTA domain-containing Ser/Thr kinase [Micrococcus luteus]|uniref:Stk1 family PASTA domain-containing Ser/Thr kinase n=1 Tax=Micrococcus luteus TaxID=1270 RepID=UPI003324EC9D